MRESRDGILIFVVFCRVVATVTHYFYRRLITACFLSALVSTLLSQMVTFLRLGCLDPVFPIAVAVGGCIPLVIALLVDAVMHRFRHS